MARTEHDYLQDLTVHLRLAGLDGRAVGEILEEARDHLEASGQPPEEAFGPAETYAAALARSRSEAGAHRWAKLSGSDLVAGAAQLAGWLLLGSGMTNLVVGRWRWCGTPRRSSRSRPGRRSPPAAP